MSLGRRNVKSKGMSLMEVMLAAAVGGIVVLLSGLVITGHFQAIRQFETLGEIEMQRQILLYSLHDERGWSRTFEQATFDCIRDSTPCAPGPHQFNILDARGDIAWSPTIAGVPAGFALRTGQCAWGTEDCPYRFVVVWQPTCGTTGSGANCLHPIIEITGSFQAVASQTASGPALNTDRYAFRLVRSFSPTQVADFCAMAGGTYNAISSTCSYSLTYPGCPANQFLVGFDSGNTPVCRLLQDIAGTCNPEQLVQGFLPNGRVTCRRIRLDCPVGECIRGFDARGDAICDAI